MATRWFGGPLSQSIVAKAAGHELLAGFSRINLALFFYSGQYGGLVFERSLLQLNFITTLFATVGAGHLVVTLARDRSTEAARRVAVLLLFPALFVAGLGSANAFTWYPWYYGPLYPLLGALAAIGAGVLYHRLPAGWNRFATACTCAILIAAQAVAAVTVKLPRDRDFRVDGYVSVTEGIPRRSENRVAALEIGVVGWQTWPAEIVDLEGLITPEAVGRDRITFLAEAQPDYIVVRTDNAAALLADTAAVAEWRSGYRPMVSVADPYVDREFRSYVRSPPTGGR